MRSSLQRPSAGGWLLRGACAALCVAAALVCGMQAAARAGEQAQPAKAPAALAGEDAPDVVITVPNRGRIVIDRRKAADLGLSLRDVLAQVYERARQSNVSLDDLARTLLSTPDGKLVRLGDIATVAALGSASQPAKPATRDGRVKSRVLTQAFAALWPRIAAARAAAGSGEPAPKLTPELLEALTDVTDAFWVTPQAERRFEAGEFDDEHDAQKLAAVLHEFTRRKASVPPALAYFDEQCRAGRLKGAQLAVASRMATDFLLQERQRAKVVATHPQGSKLSFRVAPCLEGLGIPVLPGAEVDRYKKDLAANSPGPGLKRGDTYAWFQADGDQSGVDGLILADYQGRKYVLLCNDAPHIMLPEQAGRDAWGLADAYVVTDSRNAPAVGFRFDKAGGWQFAELTRKNLRCRLAILVDDKVFSAPRIMTVISERGIMTGRFTPDQARELVWALEKGMCPQPNEAKRPARPKEPTEPREPRKRADK